VEVQINKKFLKDLVKIPTKDRIKIEQFVFDRCEKLQSVDSISSIKKLSGFKNFYRIRFGNYRIGIKYQNEVIVFERVLHRKDIYTFFP